MQAPPAPSCAWRLEITRSAGLSDGVLMALPGRDRRIEVQCSAAVPFILGREEAVIKTLLELRKDYLQWLHRSHVEFRPEPGGDGLIVKNLGKNAPIVGEWPLAQNQEATLRRGQVLYF